MREVLDLWAPQRTAIGTLPTPGLVITGSLSDMSLLFSSLTLSAFMAPPSWRTTRESSPKTLFLSADRHRGHVN